MLLQAQIKNMLDHSLMQENHFEPQLAEAPIVELLVSTIKLLHGQAEMKNIKFNILAGCENMSMLVDSVRIQ